MEGRKIKQLTFNDGSAVTASTCKAQLMFWRENYSDGEPESWVVSLKNNKEVGRYSISNIFYIEWE